MIKFRSVALGRVASQRGFTLVELLVVLAIISILLSVLIPATWSALKSARQSAATQSSHGIGELMTQYALDNGQYPDGASSTEVMQKLIDGGYITDLAVLYIPMEGKVAPERGQKKLKPENLSFDLTAGADSKDSPSLPLLYITGYRMAFTPGAVVRPSSGKFPNFGNGYHFLFFPWDDLPDHLHMPGIAVYYNGHNTVWCEPQGDSIPNIVPLGFDAHGKTYRQLTPDGVLR